MKDEIKKLIDGLENFPIELNEFVKTKTKDELDQKTKLGVWTINQVIHHLADSHMNAFIRVKLALTENTPTIKPYDETKFALTKDATYDAEDSLQLLIHLHNRWAKLFLSLNDEEFEKDFFHPEMNKKIKIEDVLKTYANHGKRHFEFIKDTFK